MRTPNNSLDRTAMSAGLGVFAESRRAAALMAVGQLGRSHEMSGPVVDREFNRKERTERKG